MSRRPTTPEQHEYLLLPEAADYARAPIATVRYWIQTGRLVAYRPGRRVLVRRADLIAFIARSATTPVGEVA